MINSTSVKKIYETQEGVASYPIPFEFRTDAVSGQPMLSVFLNDSVLAYGSDYTLSNDGHSIVLANTSAGLKLEIWRDTVKTQDSDYTLGLINPEQIEKDLDRLTMVDQELAQAEEDIATEVALAKARLSIVEGDIDLLEDKDSELENAISEEAENRAHDDGILLEKIEQLSARNEDYRVEAQNAIAAEATARSTAIANLQEAISEEISERTIVDTNLNNLIADTNERVASVLGMVRDVDAKVDTKQDELVAGNNIKIEGNVISAEGGGSDGIKQYTSMPVAADVAGEVAQYIGADGDYKHGYFYESVEQSGGTNSYSDFDYARETDVTDTDVLFDFVNAALESGGQSPLAEGDSVAIGFWRTTDLEYEEKEGFNYIKRTSSGGVSQTVEVTDEWLETNYPDGYGLDMAGVPECVTFTVTGIAATTYVWQELDLAGEALKNLATGNQSLTVLGTSAADNFSVNVGTASATSGTRAVAVGNVSSAKGNQAVAVGFGATSSGAQSTSVGGSAQATSHGAVSVGYNAKATTTNAVQLGEGTNSSTNTLQYRSYTVIDNKGKVPLARLDGVVKQFTSMPSASAYVGGIVQYIGEDGDYKKGSFYKCASETQTVYSASGYTLGGPAITINFDEAKFLAQNPVWADHGVPTWRADGGVNGWNVWTQTPSLTISNADLRDVWGVEVLGDGEPIAVDGASIQITQQEEVTYYWVEVEFGGGAEFPDQTGNAGKFLQTNGGEVSWGNALENNSESNTSYSLSNVTAKSGLQQVFIGDGLTVTQSLAGATFNRLVVIGANAKCSGPALVIGGNAQGGSSFSLTDFATVVGVGAKATGAGASSYGHGASATGKKSVAIGRSASASAAGSIQIGSGSNSTADTFSVGNTNGNFEMMDANGNIPVERLSNIIDQDPNEANGSYILNIGDRMVMMGGMVDIEDIQQGAIAEDIQIEYPTSLGDSTHIFPSVTIISSDSHGLTSWVSDRREDRIDVCVRNDGDQPATGVKIAWQVIGMKSV